MSAYDDFAQVAAHQCARVAETQRSAIEQAGAWVAEALQRDRFFYVFGTGHSHLLAEEVFYRAGGLARAVPMLVEDLMLHENAIEATYRERDTGYAAQLLRDYRLEAGDVLVVASNGGRNAVPVELAIGAREMGVKTVAVTNCAQSFSWPSRHSSGRRLAEVTDIVIDNCGVNGDAAISLPDFPYRIGPPSSLTGLLIINLIVVHAIEVAVRNGQVPEVYISSNTNGDSHNQGLLEKYRSHIRHL